MDPSADRKSPDFRSIPVRRPNPMMLSAKPSGTPGRANAKMNPSGREISVTRAGAKNPGRTGIV